MGFRGSLKLGKRRRAEPSHLAALLSFQKRTHDSRSVFRSHSWRSSRSLLGRSLREEESNPLGFGLLARSPFPRFLRFLANDPSDSSLLYGVRSTVSPVFFFKRSLSPSTSSSDLEFSSEVSDASHLALESKLSGLGS